MTSLRTLSASSLKAGRTLPVRPGLLFASRHVRRARLHGVHLPPQCRGAASISYPRSRRGRGRLCIRIAATTCRAAISTRTIRCDRPRVSTAATHGAAIHSRCA